MPNDPPIRAYNDRNVYILGAGFSADAGFPLIKDFMNRMRDAAAWLEAQGGRNAEKEAIERVLEFRIRAAAAAHRVPLNIENVEELFSLASASGDKKLADSMPLAIAATLEYARQTAKPTDVWSRLQIGVLDRPDWKRPASWRMPLSYIQEDMKKGVRKGQWHSCPPYDFYMGVMCGYFNNNGDNHRDTIITFNYDNLIEQSLQELDLPFHYGLPIEAISFDQSAARIKNSYANAGVALLKLHGSVNWIALLPEQQERLGRRVLLAQLQVDEGKAVKPNRRLSGKPGYMRLSLCENYDAVRARGVSPFLVPPTWHKMFVGFFAGVWDAAVAALKTATNLVILGYSVPPTDVHFRYLLAAGLQDNISLRKVFFVNPALGDEAGNAAERKRLENQLIGPAGLFRPELREQGVIELIPADTREFFTGPHDANSRESYRERMGRPLNTYTCSGDDAPFSVSDSQGRTFRR
ncbi:MAG: SIR2 family protein [Candidatus Binatus sp.]|uniref:SIR2 family protein n=1 Tax=Candidatus Binatus sp. TaxID=2811406 RepID=UPI00271ACDE7|nr:SIR2 family protein [Candidatus Binatus sp.]MDO8433937.1 SIR2 family protein [Candidatus Binatus sp.]